MIVVFVDALTRPEDERLLELLGVSACFSPGPDGTAVRRCASGRSGRSGSTRVAAGQLVG